VSALAAPRRHRAASLGRGLATLAAVIATVLCGTGWLYLLRRTGALAAGPSLREALPLQRLAGGAAQPLARVAAAWLPAGLAGGAALHALGAGGRARRAVALGIGTALALLALGAGADAVTASEPLRIHLAAQPQRAAPWVAAALVAAGAALPGRVRR
jgi:hypothetical protein